MEREGTTGKKHGSGRTRKLGNEKRGNDQEKSAEKQKIMYRQRYDIQEKTDTECHKNDSK